MAMKMRSATGPNILNTPKQINPQAKTKIIELSSWENRTGVCFACNDNALFGG
jgi:hypothetical protein